MTQHRSELDIILDKYIDMPMDEERTFDKTRQDYKQTIACTKRIIDGELDIINGFELTFNDEYTKIKKHEYTTRANR